MDALRKQSRIRAVHAACRAQGIDEETRKALQLQVTGKASLKDMSALDLSDVLDYLNRHARGEQPGAEWRFVFKLPPERKAMAAKVYRLAEKLGAARGVGIMSKRYIEGIAEQMLGADTVLQFCDASTLHKVVQALEVHLKRIGVK